MSLSPNARQKIWAACEEHKDDLLYEYETGGLLVASLADRPEMMGIGVTDALCDVVADSWHWGLHWNSDVFDEHVAELKSRGGLQRVVGSWHTHPGQETGSAEPSKLDVQCALQMHSDLTKASLFRQMREWWWVELIVRPAGSVGDSLYQWRQLAYHPWLIGPPLEPEGEPRVVRAELLW